MVEARSPLREQVAATLRTAITAGELAPGDHLREERLAEEYGVSRVPVREALRQLAAEGFVEIRPNRGAVVARPTVEEAQGLLDVREALEALVARQAAEHRTPTQLAQLRDIVAQADEALAEGRIRDLVDLNGRFHATLADASGNPVAVELIAQLRSKLDWVYAVDVEAQGAESWSEHAAIVEAVADQDRGRAVALIDAHLRRAQSVFRRCG